MAKSKSSQTHISTQERQQMIEETAYFRAKERGFDPSDVLRDWFEAEKIVDKYLEKHKKQVTEH